MTDKPNDTRVLVNLSPPSDPTSTTTTTTDTTTVTTSCTTDSSSDEDDSNSESDFLRGGSTVDNDQRSVASFLDVLPNLRASKDKRKAENRLSSLLMGGVTDTFTDNTDAADMTWPDAYNASLVLVSKWNLEDEELEKDRLNFISMLEHYGVDPEEVRNAAERGIKLPPTMIIKRYKTCRKIYTFNKLKW
eukprot:sb/3471142/